MDYSSYNDLSPNHQSNNNKRYVDDIQPMDMHNNSKKQCVPSKPHKSAKLRVPMNQSIIDVGYVLPSGERIYYIQCEWFNNDSIEIFTALDDPERKILFRASVLADKYSCATNKVGMYLQRRRHVTGGLYQSTGFTNKIQGRTGLKSGGYFLSMDVCESFANHWMKQAARHEKNESNKDGINSDHPSGSTTARYAIKNHHGDIVGTGDIDLGGSNSSMHDSSSSSTPDQSSHSILVGDHSSVSTGEHIDSIHHQNNNDHVIPSPYMMKLNDNVYSTHSSSIASPSPIPPQYAYNSQSNDIIPSDYKQPIWSQLIQSQLQQYPISKPSDGIRSSSDVQLHSTNGYFENSPYTGSSNGVHNDTINSNNHMHVPLQLRAPSISPFHMKETNDACNSSLMLPSIPIRSQSPLTPLLIDGSSNNNNSSIMSRKPHYAPTRPFGTQPVMHPLSYHHHSSNRVHQSLGSKTLLEQQLRHALDMEMLPSHHTSYHHHNNNNYMSDNNPIQHQSYNQLLADQQLEDSYVHHSDQSHITSHQQYNLTQHHNINNIHHNSNTNNYSSYDKYSNQSYNDSMMYNDLLSSQSTFQYGLTIEQVNQLRRAIRS